MKYKIVNITMNRYTKMNIIKSLKYYSILLIFILIGCTEINQRVANEQAFQKLKHEINFTEECVNLAKCLKAKYFVQYINLRDNNDLTLECRIHSKVINKLDSSGLGIYDSKDEIWKMKLICQVKDKLKGVLQ